MPAPSDLRVGAPGELADAVTRSHLADGRVVGWYGAAGVVIDAEIADAPVPAALAARHGTERFWERWTTAECLAKAHDVPIAVWLREHGLPDAEPADAERAGAEPADAEPAGAEPAGDLAVSTVTWQGLVVSFGSVARITAGGGVTPAGGVRHIGERFPARNTRA